MPNSLLRTNHAWQPDYADLDWSGPNFSEEIKTTSRPKHRPQHRFESIDLYGVKKTMLRAELAEFFLVCRPIPPLVTFWSSLHNEVNKKLSNNFVEIA